MATRWPSWILVSAQYLKMHFSNWFEIWHICWFILNKGQVWFSTRSEIQDGHQVAIMDFCFRSISQETFEKLILNLAYLLVQVRRRLCSILDLIKNLIWLPGSHFEFLIPLNIWRSVWAIDLKFVTFIGTYKAKVRFDFGPNRKSNMATWLPSWIFISAQYFKKRLSNWFEIKHTVYIGTY